jgi:hypothetical protein
MAPNTQDIRDFVYLDWERVRSLAAQLFRGVPESTSTEEGKEGAGRGALGFSAAGLLKAEGGLDYRYLRNDRETRSLHHYVYGLVEHQLVSDDRIVVVDGAFDFSLWTREVLRDGQFVMATGIVRIMDYDWVAKMMEALPAMMRAAQHAEDRSLAQQRAAGLITDRDVQGKRKEHKQQLDELKSLKIDELTGLTRNLYGDAVRVKVMPDRQRPRFLFVGSGARESFQDSAASLAQKYGYEVDAGWTMLAQVNITTEQDAPQAIPIGNDMEDAFEKVALAVNSMIQVASACRFPVVSVTPLSLYRQC